MALISKCIENKTEVVVFVRQNSPRADRIPDSQYIIKVECGLDEMKNLEVTDSLKGCEAFYHFAWEGTSGPARNDMYMQNRNVQHTLDAVYLASGMGCRVFIGAGSQAEYGLKTGVLHPDDACDPVTGYGMAKLCAGYMSRSLCKELKISHIWARILSVYGPYDNERAMIISVINKLLKGEKVSLTKGEQIWDYLYSGDVAEILYKLGEKASTDSAFASNGKVYCLGSGIGKPLREYIDILRDETGVSGTLGYGDIPYSDNQVMHLEADISDLVKDIDYTPNTDFTTGIRETIDWCKNN